MATSKNFLVASVGHLLRLVAGLAFCLSCHDALALPKQRTGRDKPAFLTAGKSPPLNFRLAKGETDACGPGCNEWIAAEGFFDAGAHRRFQSFLRSISGGRKLPVFFHSGGGLTPQAFAIGRLLRGRGLTAGVGKTVLRGCPSSDRESATNNVADACSLQERLPPNAVFDLSSFAQCNSACVYALMGGKDRRVLPGALLRVHSGKTVRVHGDGKIQILPDSDGNRKALHAQLRSYVREMGIDSGILDVIAQVPFEKTRVLSRDEIAKFGIDKHEFQETRWMIVKVPQRVPTIVKMTLQAGGAYREEFRVGILRFACQASGSVGITHIRGLSVGEMGAPSTINLASEGRRLELVRIGTPQHYAWIDPYTLFDVSGSSSGLDFFKAAAKHSDIDLIFSDPKGLRPLRLMKLSTSGLSQALEALGDCRSATSQ